MTSQIKQICLQKTVVKLKFLVFKGPADNNYFPRCNFCTQSSVISNLLKQGSGPIFSFLRLCLVHLNTRQQFEPWLCLLRQMHWTDFVELDPVADLQPKSTKGISSTVIVVIICVDGCIIGTRGKLTSDKDAQ